MNKKLTMLSGAVMFAVMTATLPAEADVVYQFNSAGTTFGLAGVRTADGYFSLEVYQDGTGPNQVTHLLYYLNDAQGFGLWEGTIPASAVTTTGVNSMHVAVDTCGLTTGYGSCRYVDVTWNKTPGHIWSGSLVQHTADDGTIYQAAGAMTFFPASGSGSVGSISTTNSTDWTIGTATSVNVTITKP